MTEIGGADRILLQLRLQLQRLKEAQAKRPSDAQPSRAQATPLERLRQLSATASLSDDDLGKLLISSFLADEFGAAAANDARFQVLIEQIFVAIERDPSGRALLQAALNEIRRG